jgi:heat shock protein HslJ
LRRTARFQTKGEQLILFDERGTDLASFITTAPQEVLSKLTDRKWKLAGSDGRATITFRANGDYHGRDTCNSLDGTWLASRDTIAFGNDRSSLVGCRDEGMGRRLQQATQWQVNEGKLILLDSHGNQVAVFSR